MNFEKLKEDFQDYTYSQRRALIAISLVAILFATFLFTNTRGRAVAQESPKPALTMPAVAKTILIHVAGKVKRPDVYPLLAGSRVSDAIKAAGGAQKGVDLSDINLARVLVDGEQVYVGYVAKVSSSSSSKSKKTKFTGVINVNRATKAEFDSLAGIGPVIASRIINYRSANGPFLALDDLLKVSGIGSKTLERIRPRLSL
ncbi:MAG: ComEA family DNA-binding protein [Candidatus Nanopelagicaceae bacterium]|jgi:competence protein ComEA|nr:ComEA family DNA-binding protein [Candidatus Nanopelagicaceae bacterium]MDP5046521.1 ComEA family DNA-binding protein [Candidatus Nanopelagicaceae bacterium]